MMELREKIVKALESIEGYRGLEHEQQADAILQIPEIRIALYQAEPSYDCSVCGQDLERD
jgi:hypothetical protein